MIDKQDLNPLNNILLRAVPNLQVLSEEAKNYSKVVFFIDFNNCIRGMYYPENMETILTYIVKNNSQIPDILIKEWARFQSYLETWGKYNNKKIKTMYFSESGQSYYHKNLMKDYKAGRNQQLFQIPDSLLSAFDSVEKVTEVYRNFKHLSWKWISSISKKVGVSTVLLHNIDADFFPEYLFRKTKFYEDDVLYVIISSDGDMIQTLDLGDNIIILNGSDVIRYNNWQISKSYLRNVFAETNLTPTPDKVIMFKAIVGDSSDKIKGIPGIGGKAFVKNIIPYVSDDVRADNLIEIKKEFESIKAKNPTNKTIKKVLEYWDTYVLCVKLVSFNHLIENIAITPSKLDELNKAIEEDNLQTLNEYSGLNNYLEMI